MHGILGTKLSQRHAPPRSSCVVVAKERVASARSGQGHALASLSRVSHAKVMETSMLRRWHEDQLSRWDAIVQTAGHELAARESSTRQDLSAMVAMPSPILVSSRRGIILNQGNLFSTVLSRHRFFNHVQSLSFSLFSLSLRDIISNTTHILSQQACQARQPRQADTCA